MANITILVARLLAGMMLRASLWKEVVGALIIIAKLANASFAGLPTIEVFYGRGHLATGILIDRLGTDLVLSTLGIAMACLARERQSQADHAAARSKDGLRSPAE